MHVETMMFLGWIALPLIAYAGGRLALSRTERGRKDLLAPDAEQRLAHLRRMRDDGLVAPRGRIADALRLAEGAGALAASEVRQT